MPSRWPYQWMQLTLVLATHHGGGELPARTTTEAGCSSPTVARPPARETALCQGRPEASQAPPATCGGEGFTCKQKGPRMATRPSVALRPARWREAQGYLQLQLGGGSSRWVVEAMLGSEPLFPGGPRKRSGGGRTEGPENRETKSDH